MSGFLLVGGLLLVGVLLALVWPLLRGQGAALPDSDGFRELNLKVLREQLAELEREFAAGRLEHSLYLQSKEELERRTLDDAALNSAPVSIGQRKIKLAVALAVLFPVLVFALYSFVGAPQAISGKIPTTTGAAGDHPLTPEQISGMVEKLALRLQDNPEDGEGWLMLGRSYTVLRRYPEAAAAFGRAVTLLPPDAQRYADFADIVAMAQGKSLRGEPEKLVRKALEIDPANIKALALSGTIAFDHQDYGQAIRQWQQVLASVPEGSPVALGMQGSIRDAENRMAISGKQASESKPASSTEPVVPSQVAGMVELDPVLRSEISPSDTLFIFARAIDGPKMPVAMLKKKVSDLPLKFSLDDGMAMTPQFKLSTVGKVLIGARISKSGDALARPGDLEGISVPVIVGAVDVRILINKMVR
jgi:cytochrome c-type biogenesis protein CcmH